MGVGQLRKKQFPCRSYCDKPIICPVCGFHRNYCECVAVVVHKNGYRKA